MKRKIVWLVASCLMVAALLLASCAPAVTEEKKVTPPVKEEEVAPPKEKEEVVVPGKEMVKDALGRLVEKPKYGGTLTEVLKDPILGHEQELMSSPGMAVGTNLANELLVQADWLKGPVGTNETIWWSSIDQKPEDKVGWLAESWEYPDPNTVVFHIRKGVHFALDPTKEASRLVNGREMNAYDVAYVINRGWTLPTSYWQRAYPRAMYIESIEATDKWTVVVKSKPGKMGTIYITPETVIRIYPPEVTEKYGNMNKAELVVGTGPFMVEGEVPASSLTWVRNPNYWRNHPLYPEDRMPYIDRVKYLIIPDASTRMAALRTAKIDILRDMAWEDAEPLLKANSELKWTTRPGDEPTIGFRLDRPELPFADIKVRYALMMAINREAIKDIYYKGKARYPLWWLSPAYPHLYTPLEKQPESIQGIYRYNPEKAKQLLAEAGYPKGFKTEVVLLVRDVDLMSIVKEDWAKIGVDLKLDVKEFAVLTTLYVKKNYNEMMLRAHSWSLPGFRYAQILADTAMNWGRVNDPIIQATEAKTAAAFPDFAKRDALLKEIEAHVLEQAYYTSLPAPEFFHLWQPWVKDFHGEYSVGYAVTVYTGDVQQFLWINQDLKEAMTGRR